MSKEIKDQEQLMVPIGDVDPELLNNARKLYQNCDFTLALKVLAKMINSDSCEIPSIVYLGFLACLYAKKEFAELEKQCGSDNFSKVSNKEMMETFWGAPYQPCSIDPVHFPKAAQFFSQYPCFAEPLPMHDHLESHKGFVGVG